MLFSTPGIIGAKNPGINTGTSVLLIQKKSYPPSTTTANFDFNSSLGGGGISFSGHQTYNNSSQWGPHQLFDNARSLSDWCNLSGENLFGIWTFPTRVVITKIFIIPRIQEDKFPLLASLLINGITVGEYLPQTISQALGMQMSYSGTGYYIQPNTASTSWRLNFSGTNAYIGEIEFWGYLAT